MHKLRDELGLDVLAFDAAGGVGGTWYWNRYPGARVDIESMDYSYSFSEELQQEWHWTERYAGQPEILRYLNHVADRFDLRRRHTFDTRVTGGDLRRARRALDRRRPTGRPSAGPVLIWRRHACRSPKKPDFPGVDDFAGEVYHTGSWPHEDRWTSPASGSASSAPAPRASRRSGDRQEAGHLTVFQRTPNYATPIGNSPTGPRRRGPQQSRTTGRSGTPRATTSWAFPTPRSSPPRWRSAPTCGARSSTTAGSAAGSGCSSTRSATSCSTRPPTTQSRSTSASASASG